MTVEENPSSGSRSAVGRIAHALPGVLAWGALLAVGAWGHHTGWAAPSFAALFGGGSKTAEDWCAEHGVPFSQCIACHPELAGESAADWCKEHGVPESKCTICHPEILKTGVAADWCKDHGVPESCCTICHPELARRDGNALPDDGPDVLGEPATPPAPTPGLDPSTCQKHAMKVQFASVATVEKAGVRLGKVTERSMAEAIPAPAEIEYDRRRHAQVGARTAGRIRQVAIALGSEVAAGDLLLVIESAECGRAKTELLAAQAADAAARALLARIERGLADGTRTESERASAMAAATASGVHLVEARQALAAFDLEVPAGELQSAQLARLSLPTGVLPEVTDNLNLLPVRAPIAGTVVALDVGTGEATSHGQVLAVVADTRQLAVRIAVPEAMAARVQQGARVVFRARLQRDEPFSGSVEWISTAVDENTRTVAVRAVVDNRDGRLRAGTMGTAQIVVRPAAKVIAVPTAAVQWEGCCQVVFVRLADTVFQPRKVRLGVRDAAFTEVLVGVLPDEVVVTDGSAVLTAALLKSNLGAGCCGDK